ncbi:hypothetical protein K4I03_1895 [Streptococcus sanguinis]|nr:hypothetical protein [Streptococcus sanguinis]
MPRKERESMRQKRQTKFQQGQKRAGKVQENQELAITEAERQEVTKNRVENKCSTPVERDRKGILGRKLVNKQVLWLSVGFLSILLLLSVPYLVERFEHFLSPQRVLDEYVDKGNNHFDWTYEDISQLQLQKKSDVDERSGSGLTPKDIVKKFGKAQSGNLAPFLNQTDGRMSLFYSREEPRQRLSFYFEKINNEYQLSGIYSYNLASSQHVQSRTDLKEEDFEHLVLGKEFQNEDGTSYQEILEKFGLSKYIEIDSGGESGQKLNVLYKLKDGKYVSLWFTVSQAGDYLLYEKHIT